MTDSEDELERYVFEVAWEVANKGKECLLIVFRSPLSGIYLGDRSVFLGGLAPVDVTPNAPGLCPCNCVYV